MAKKKSTKKAKPETKKESQDSKLYHPPGFRTVPGDVPGTYRHVPTA